jgi:hypothetical protein
MPPRKAVGRSDTTLRWLEQYAQAAPRAPLRSHALVVAAAMQETEDGAWRSCGPGEYRFEPAAGGAYALTAQGAEAVEQVLDPDELRRAGHEPARVRVHFVVVGRLLLDQVPAACSGKTMMTSVVVGALTVEAEAGVDLNEPRASEQPHVRAARLLSVGRPAQCLRQRAEPPPPHCLLPLAVAVGSGDAAKARKLARALGGEWAATIGAVPPERAE